MIIDFHTHIFPPEVTAQRQAYLDRDRWFGELYQDPRAKTATAEDLVAEMDRAGVDRAVTFGFAWTDPGLLKANNDYAIDAVRRYPDRLIGFAGVNPANRAAAVGEIDRCARLGMQGLGELMPDAQGFRLDDVRTMTPLVEAATHHQLVLLTHVSEPLGHMYPGKGETGPDQVVRFAEQFPEATLVCAHWGGGLLFHELMPELMLTLRNVYYDTAATHLLYRDRIFKLALGLIPDKVLWATDYPLVSQAACLNRLAWSRLAKQESDKILGENAERVLSGKAVS